MQVPGPLLASGRDADIFEHGRGLVLRRSRAGRSMRNEAHAMEYVRAHGYPVPAVHEVSEDESELVMERIDGPSMGDYLRKRPWALRQQGRVLAALHQRLHEIPPPPFVPSSPVGDGDHLLHLDLHPLNVILDDRGPMVIDWSNAARGDAIDDVALAQLLMTSGQLPGAAIVRRVEGMARALLVNSFLDQFDRDLVAGRLRRVAAWKVKDPHMTTAEVRGIWAAVARFEASG